MRSLQETLDVFSCFSQLRPRTALFDTEHLGDLFMLKSFNDAEVEYRFISVRNPVDQVEQFIGAHLADDVGLDRGIREVIPEIINWFSFTVFNMADTRIHAYPANPSFKRSFIPVLPQVLKYPDETVLHHIFRMLLPGVPPAYRQ